MNFEELFKYCQELNKSNSEKCLVCHIPIEKNHKHIKLNCKHEITNYTNIFLQKFLTWFFDSLILIFFNNF